MRITDVFAQTGQIDALKKASGAKPVQKSESAQKAKSDSVTISSQAKNLSETDTQVKTAKARINATPDVRQDRIDAVREKIANGFYDSDEFKEKLADRLMNEFGLNS